MLPVKSRGRVKGLELRDAGVSRHLLGAELGNPGPLPVHKRPRLWRCKALFPPLTRCTIKDFDGFRVSGAS